MAPLLVNFHGAASGDWHVTSQNCLVGPTLPLAPCMVIGAHDGWQSPRWSLAGVVSNLRYTTAAERADLTASHSGLGRTEAVCGALIPIRKSPAWWALAQDERRAIYARSQHTPIGLDYLP
ncbi:MAG: chlorite dismutase, partial [Sphingomonadaceae bacterium]